VRHGEYRGWTNIYSLFGATGTALRCCFPTDYTAVRSSYFFNDSHRESVDVVGKVEGDVEFGVSGKEQVSRGKFFERVADLSRGY